MDFENSPELDKYKAELEEKKKTVIRGDDVIHLTYLSPLFDKEILDELQNDLAEVKIRLSSWDDFGVMKASLEDYTLQVYLSICNPITLEILKTIGLNTIWETVKYSTLKLHKKMFNSDSAFSPGVSPKVNFGVKMHVSKEVSFEFELDGNLSDDLILESLDKSLTFIKEHNETNFPIIELPVYSTFDKSKKSWKRVKVVEELKKKRKKSKKK